ncbi:MAG: TetR/AcrR family transcriptional regulator [Acutalibacteraceae bacterium]
MNNCSTSKEEIMQVCRRLAAEKGLKALRMRTVAEECHIALGTLYNYYTDKDTLVLSAVESIWRDIFHAAPTEQPSGAFPDHVAQLYAQMQKGAAAYPGFLAEHSVRIASSKRCEAKNAMQDALAHIRAGMCKALQNDPSVSPDTFSAAFSPEDLVGFVLDHLMILLMQARPDCTALSELLRRVLYPSPHTTASFISNTLLED